jgi:rare lipoprotein A
VQVAQAPAAAPVTVDETTRVVRGAPRPPERPFDLSTIPGAATPIAFAGAAPRAAQPQAAGRSTVASLFFAPEQASRQTFSKTNPLSRDLKPQTFVPLTRQ